MKAPVKRRNTLPAVQDYSAPAGTTQKEDLATFAARNLKSYGSHVVEHRAIPDYRDGLKPVHRAILWSLVGLGLKPSGPHKKSARTVGDTIGKYHPHGDASVYESLVTIANTCPPLVDGQGGFGDPVTPASAMRYCFAADTLIDCGAGLKKIQDMIPNAEQGQHELQVLVPSLSGFAQTSHFHVMAERTIYHVMSLGAVVRTTSNEPFFTLDANATASYVETKDLTVSHYLAKRVGNLMENPIGAKRMYGLEFESRVQDIAERLVFDLLSGLSEVDPGLLEATAKQLQSLLSLVLFRMPLGDWRFNTRRAAQDFATLIQCRLGILLCIKRVGDLWAYDFYSQYDRNAFEADAGSLRTGDYVNNPQRRSMPAPVISYFKSKLCVYDFPASVTDATTFEELLALLTSVGRVFGPSAALSEMLSVLLQCSDYCFVPLDSVVRTDRKEVVYDFSVPSEHSYVADGFLVHNTEAKISRFAQTFLLDPEYMKVVPKVPNFSNDDIIPLYMPALLPTLMFMTSVPAPAYGVKAGNPAFSFRSVSNVVCQLLKGKPITQKLLDKLELFHPWGCRDATSLGDKTELLKTGKGKVSYVPRHQVDYSKKCIYIQSYVPMSLSSDAQIEKNLNKIQSIEGVRSAENCPGQQDKRSGPYGALFVVECQKNLPEERLDDIFNQVMEIVSSDVHYRLGVTIRTPQSEDISFRYVTFERYLRNWIKYRIALETRLVDAKIADTEKELHLQELYLLAVTHIDKLLKALPKVLSSDDPDVTLSRILKIPADDARIILDRKVRQLAKLEKADLEKKIRDLKAVLSGLHDDKMDMGGRAARVTQERVATYLKNPDKMQSGLLIEA